MLIKLNDCNANAVTSSKIVKQMDITIIKRLHESLVTEHQELQKSWLPN
jgi:hypothetical protein